MSPNLDLVINFLATLYKQGLSYSAVNSARSALSTFLFVEGRPVGQHPLVIRLLKGIFNSRPALPRTNVTWDPEIVLKLIKNKFSPSARLKLFQLTLKVTTLLWLLTGQRSQSLHLIDTRNLTLSDHALKIRFGDPLKTTRPGFHQEEIKILAFAPNRQLCLVTAMKCYLQLTKKLRGQETSLLITTQKPFKGASRDTISRWVRLVMKMAGLDTTVFTPHSVRGASTSAAYRAKVPIQTILKTAGWTRESTFSKYYCKPLIQGGYGEAVLAAKRN